VSGVEYDEESETEEERQLKTFTLKQLIRKLHITEPVDHVMSLIGKKYAFLFFFENFFPKI
jgi:telomerase protein component 1